MTTQCIVQTEFSPVYSAVGAIEKNNNLTLCLKNKKEKGNVFCCLLAYGRFLTTNRMTTMPTISAMNKPTIAGRK